jgi:PAS domain S-box-containing protein
MINDKKFVLKWYNKLLFKIPIVFLLLFAALATSNTLVMKMAGEARLEEQASVSMYNKILPLSIGITAAVILAGFIVLYRSFVKPILSMSKQLRGTVEANAGTPEHVKSVSEDELGLLAYRFNLRSDQLADTLAKLYVARNSLEKRVEQRTEELTNVNQQLESEISERKEAETQLRDSQKMLQLVMDNVPQSIFWKDRNLVYVDCNINFAKNAGVEKPQDIIGKTDYDLAWRKEEADFFRQCDAEIMNSDTPRYHIVESQRQAGGKEAWLEANKVPLHDADGKVVGILGSFEDITERRDAQDKLRQSEERYRMIFANANDAIFLMDSDKFIDCNDKTLEMFACTREQIVGREPYRFSPLTQPDGRNSMEKAVEKISAALAGKPQKFEWVHSKYDGTEFYAEVTLNAFVIRGKLHVLAIVRDFSERKAAERQIEKSRQLLQQMIDSMPFGVMLVGKDKIIRIVNETAVQLTGFKKGELVGCLCHKTLCPADKDNCPVLDQKQILDRSERKATTKDNRQIPILKSVIPFKLGDEEVLLESFIDISERKRAEESMKELNYELEQAVRKLEETNQEMKNFTYIASHDLREPLRKISAFGVILRKSLTDKIDGDDAENLNFMIDGATRMSKMIEGLLAYSRVSTKTHLAEKVNLNAIVEQLGQLELSVAIEEKKAIIDVPQPLPEVEVDPVQIRQLMQNLIANGMKYQAKGSVPHITITSGPAADGMVRINITDNGIGIAPEFQQAIFIMFKRLHSRNEYEGTGIGLAVCKKIVERHGGQIGVESEPGKGSTFWFTVPAVNETNSNQLCFNNEERAKG